MNNLFYSIEEENREKNMAVVEGTFYNKNLIRSSNMSH